MTNTHKKIFAIALFLIALWRLTVFLFSSDVAPESNHLGTALGEVAAEEAVSQLQSERAWLLLVHEEAGPTIRSAVRAFESTARASGISDIRTQKLSDADAHEENGLTPDFTRSLLDAADPAAVWVSFGFFPPPRSSMHSETRSDAGNGSFPKVIVVLPNMTHAEAYLQSGEVHFIISPAFTAPEPEPTLRDPARKWFDSYFRIQTPE